MILIWKLWKLETQLFWVVCSWDNYGERERVGLFWKVQLLVSKHLAPLGLWTSRRGYRGRAKFTAPSFLEAALTAQLSFLQLIVHGHNVSAADARQQHNQSFNWSPETFPPDWLSGKYYLCQYKLKTPFNYMLLLTTSWNSSLRPKWKPVYCRWNGISGWVKYW